MLGAVACSDALGAPLSSLAEISTTVLRHYPRQVLWSREELRSRMKAVPSLGVRSEQETEEMAKVFETVAKDRMILLPDDVPSSAHCVVTVLDDGLDSLREQSQTQIPAAKQQRMSELLQKNREAQLTEGELQELDLLAEEFDRVTLTKGRALAVLAQIRGTSPGS